MVNEQVIQSVLIDGKFPVRGDVQLPFFHKLKLKSIEPFMRKAYIEARRDNNLDYKFGHYSVSLKIWEAIIFDYLNGFESNAYAGKVLAKNKCGDKASDEILKTGPSVFTKDLKIIEQNFPSPLEWANLYSVWNMSFVSNFEDFPFVVTKLLIPQVSGYQDKPNQYLYSRVIALYLRLNFKIFNENSEFKLGKNFKFKLKEFTEEFGLFNEASAFEYQKLVDDLKLKSNEKTKKDKR